MWEGYRITIPLPTYWWPRCDHTPRTTVSTTDATAKTLSISFDLVPPLNKHREQRWSLTCIVNCKGNGHNRHPQRHPTPLQPPAASSSPTPQVQQVPVPERHGFALLCVSSPAHPPTQVASDPCMANGTTIPTDGWLPHSLNLGLRSDHT
jgi:hypothetical protein